MSATVETTQDVWGSSPKMSAFETLMWRAEADPRLRSTISLLDLLDCAPDWNRLVTAHEWATRKVPRFRERVVETPLSLGPAVWAVDPNFDLSYHLRRVRLPEPGTFRQLLDLAQQLAMTPFDKARAPWEGVLIEGLEHGRAAYMLKLHHSATDGLGTMQLLGMLHGRQREATPNKGMPPTPEPETPSPLGLLAGELNAQFQSAPKTLFKSARTAVAAAAGALMRPDRAIAEATRLARSAGRVLSPPPVPRSPLLNHQSLSWRFETHELPLAQLKAAAKAAGGSVNDAFLAALLGAFRRYHAHFGVAIQSMPIAIPISLRSADDPMGGNRIAGARFAAPVAEADPVERIRQIRDFVRNARDEPAIDMLDRVAPLLSRLPTVMITRLMSDYAKGHDLQASNVPGINHPVYLAGARITHMFPFGPVPGCAAMAAIVSYDGNCCVGVNVDPAAVTDPAFFGVCLREGFDEVVALGTRGRGA